MVKIGNVEINGKIVLAPMAGITNKTYRMICKEFGAALVVGEMVSDKAIMFGNEKTKKLLDMDESERPISQQIFGSDKDSFCTAAKKVYEYMHPDIIDINMGCPVPKIAIKSQAGSALLKSPEKIYEIVKAVKESVPCPITVKIRSGWDENSINCMEVAKICEKAGASAITLHARTRSQGYSGHSDWSLIKKVKESVNIPVIGNGDVTSCYEAKKMLLETECDILILNHLHLWVRDLLDEGMEEEKIQTTILSWIKSNPDVIVICDELGNGIVPIKKQERIWREQTGRLMIELAKQAERVERILCGLGQRLK